jgi:hypothetical protein
MRINLSWSASTDDVELKDYLIERCTGGACTDFAQIAVSLVTSYADDTVAAATTYRYRVRARDVAGNLSGYSPIAEATATANEPITSGPDFHLQSGSPACHAGIYVAEVQYDLDGRQRPNPPSIGAFEGNCPLP